jgi:hypothetical protein
MISWRKATWMFLAGLLILGTLNLGQPLAEEDRSSATAAAARGAVDETLAGVDDPDPDSADEDDESTDAEGDDEDDRRAARIVGVEGRQLVVLSESERRLASVVEARLERVAVKPERYAVGVVLDERPLLTAVLEIEQAENRLALQQEKINRHQVRLAELTALSGDARVTTRRELIALEEALLAARDEELLQRQALRRLRLQLSLDWGGVMQDADADADLLTALQEGRSRLVSFATESSPSANIYVGRGGLRANAAAAQLLGPASSAVQLSAGASWVARVDLPDLRRDMRVDVWVEQTGISMEGTLLPVEAVVWHGGQPWFYRVMGEGLYRREALGSAAKHPLGWLLSKVPDPLVTVVAGAQVLLAEEFYGAIPDEDDD